MNDERTIVLEKLVIDMWHELNYEAPRADDGTNGCIDRMKEFDRRLSELGLLENSEGDVKDADTGSV